MEQILYRELALSAPSDDQAERVPATLSTEHPVDRGDYVEVLSHKRSAIDLSRFPLPLIESHDGSRLNIGLAENPRIERGRLRAEIRFSNSERGREVLADVQAGIVRSLSIGYLISEFETAGDTLTATRWLPYEVSAVSVPADPSAGFFRGKTMTEQTTTATGGENVQTERERVAAIMSVAKQRGAVDLAISFIENGKAPEEFYRELLASSRDTGRGVSIDSNPIGLTDNEVRQFSFLKAIRSQMPGADRRTKAAAGFEMECSEAAAKQYGREPQGILIPDDVLSAPIRSQRDLNVGTTTAGGHTVSTDIDSANFIELLRNNIAVEQAGARVLTGLQGNIAIPRQTGASTTYWVAESGAPTESEATFDQVTMSPKTVGAFTDFSRKLLLQSSLDIEQFVRGDLSASIGVELDRVAIEGDPDTTATANEPRGILQVSGIGNVDNGTNGGVPTRDDVIDLIHEVAVDNALRGKTGFITNSNVITRFMKTLLDSGSGKYVMESRDMLVGQALWESNNVPADGTKGSGTNLSSILFGNWDDFFIGYWSGVDLLVDPYTASTSGTVRVVALLDCDMAVRHPQSFAAITDAVTT